jgi:hypothetical protein
MNSHISMDSGHSLEIFKQKKVFLNHSLGLYSTIPCPHVNYHRVTLAL